MSFFNYFSDSEREGVSIFVTIKNKTFGAICPVLVKLRVHPDTLSYAGLSLLIGVVIWFVSHPYRSIALIILYVMIDGLDGSYARYLNRPTQAGAFTDIIADQLGMVVISLGFIFYGMVDGQIGAYYIMIYLIMIAFSVVQNAQKIPMQYIFRTKYILYLIYMIWAFTNINLAPWLIPIFCLVMTFSVVQSFVRLKRGFYYKYDLPKILKQDQEIRASGGAPPKFWSPMKVILPGIIISALLIMGGYTQIASMMEPADIKPKWIKSRELPLLEKRQKPRSVAAYKDGWLVTTYDPKTQFSWVYYLKGPNLSLGGVFRVPWALHKDHGAAAHKGRLYIADRRSRRVLDIDIEASLKNNIAVLEGSFDTTLDAPVGCAIVEYQGQERMLISEYMNHYKTIVVDYEKALELGFATEAIVGWYRNAGFSRGVAADKKHIIEMNSSLWRDLIYLVDADEAFQANYLRSGIKLKIASPRWRCRDLSINGRTIVLVDGKRPILYTAEINHPTLSPKSETQ